MRNYPIRKWLSCKVTDKDGRVYNIEGYYKKGYWKIKDDTGKVIHVSITKVAAVRWAKSYTG